MTYSSGTSTVASIDASSPLQITGGTLTVTDSIEVASAMLTVGAGTLAFGSSASMSVTGSGELTVNGTLNINNLDFSDGTLDGSGSVSLSGTNTWTGGTDDAPC